MSNPEKFRAVQFCPKYCKEAEGTPAREWDSTHDLSVITEKGLRVYVGKFRHADWAYEVGKILEQYGFSLHCHYWAELRYPSDEGYELQLEVPRYGGVVRIGTFDRKEWAAEVGELIKQHGLEGRFI